MRNLLNNLSTAWLLLALIVAPLQAMAAPFAGGGHDDCPMKKSGKHAVAGMHHGMHHQMDDAGSGHGQGDCPKCSDNGCNGDQCKDSGCGTAQLQPSAGPVVLQLERQPVTDLVPGYRTHFISLPPSPLYRPPV
jgi:hypothetical protein